MYMYIYIYIYIYICILIYIYIYKMQTISKVQNITDFSWFELIEQNMKYTICIQVKKCQ